MDRDTEARIKAVFSEWDSSFRIKSIIAMTPDASFRRYFRIFPGETSEDVSSIMAMVFDSLVCPEASGSEKIDSDRTYVELSELFVPNGISVPELYFYSRSQHVILIEDLGDVHLSHVMTEESQPEDGSAVERLFELAIDEILKIQSIACREGFFAFERSFSSVVYQKEMGEFVDYVLKPRNVPDKCRSITHELIETLAYELSAQDLVLVHRDFHPWNLMVCGGRLRVIDFQDALLGPSCYDLVGLLNDRDADEALGLERYNRLIGYFLEQSGFGDEFYGRYDRVLLQRDLKVAGRFSKLVSERGLANYEKWVPGTLRRIGRTLERISRAKAVNAVYYCSLECLKSVLPEIAAGASTPWTLRQGSEK